MPTVLIQGRIAAPRLELLKTYLPQDWTATSWDPSTDVVDDFAPLAVEADVIVGGGIPIAWPDVPKLKLFQIPWAGYDFTGPERMPKDVPVANTFEHETAIAEYVLLGMLEWEIGLSKMDKTFREGGWGGAAQGLAPPHGELLGKTLGIVGYGHIGRETATRAKAFGMRCIGVRRSKQLCPDELDWLGKTDQLDQLLAESDFVLVACDMNEETIGMFDFERLTKMKPTGVIINVARGKIIDETALWDAVSNRKIGGAIIDVWYNYKSNPDDDVWPTNYPFQDLDNVILSGHRSATTDMMWDRRYRFVAENCGRIGRGEAPLNVVFHGNAG